MKKQAFAYLRVSGMSQIKGDGFARQEKAVRDYAKSHNIDIVKVYKEQGVSGSIANRPTLAQMMVDLEQNGHGVKTVLIEKMDRLARDLIIQETIVTDFKKNDIELLSALEGKNLLSDDPTRKLIRQMLGSIAEYEKAMIVQKLRAARERKKVKNGKCEGRKGYQDTSAGESIIKEIKKLHRKKPGQKRLTSQAIADKMNDTGYTTITGKPFTSQIIRNILAKK